MYTYMWIWTTECLYSHTHIYTQVYTCDITIHTWRYIWEAAHRIDNGNYLQGGEDGWGGLNRWIFSLFCVLWHIGLFLFLFLFFQIVFLQ